MGAVQYAGRRRVLTFAWGTGAGTVSPPVENPATPAPATAAPAGPEARQPATLTGMPKPDGRLTFEERAKRANAARQDALTEEERREIARKASQSATGPLVRARQLAKGWATASEEDRREIRRVLREAGIIR